METFRSPCQRSVAVMMRSSFGRRRWRIAPRVGPQHNHAKSALHGACAACTVSQYSAGRQARGPRAMGFEHDEHALLYLVLSTYCGVGTIEPRPTARGGAHRALAHHTTTPSTHCTARVLRARSANTSRMKSSRAVATDSNTRTTILYSPCRPPVAVLVRSSLGRRRGEERAPRWSTTQPHQVQTSWRVRHRCSADTPRGATRAGRATGFEGRKRYFKARAADLSR